MAAKSCAAIVAFAGSIACSGAAHAAGFALDVQSGRGTGMASSVTGFIDDSSAIFYNPAGISQGKGFDAQIGETLVVPSFKYTSRAGDSTSTPFRVIPPFNAYVTGGITDELSIGVGVFTPYGLTLEWPEGWEGHRQITKAALQTFNINPTAAYRFGPVRLGAGLQVVRSVVELQRDIVFGQTTGSTDLGAATWGFGGNVGAQVEAIPKKLSIGVHYRSAVKLSFDDGLAHFENVPRPLTNAIHDQAVTTSFITPNSIAAGVAVRPIPSLVVDLDVVWYQWSSFRAISLTFPNDASNTLSSSQAKDWENTVNVHLGTEAILNDTWRVRAGALFDPSPAPQNTLTPDIPDANRLNMALGGSYVHRSGFHADLGYQFIVLFSRTSTAPEFPGDYGGFVNILGLSLGYSTFMKKQPAATDPYPAPAVGLLSPTATTTRQR